MRMHDVASPLGRIIVAAALLGACWHLGSDTRGYSVDRDGAEPHHRQSRRHAYSNEVTVGSSTQLKL
jgi:hypothetical protein